MPFTVAQQTALAIVPKLTGGLSFFGSSCIIRSVLSDVRRHEAGTYQRLLLGMSSLDVAISFWMILSTWPIPEGTPGVWAPAGNTATCTSQGFFLQLIVGVPLYNACLAIYYLLRSRFDWTEEEIRKLEPIMHSIPLFIALGTATAGIPLKLFNNANLWCWIAPFPHGCKDSLRFGEDADCVRGDNAWFYRWVFTLGPAWLCIITAMVAMLLVYLTVLQQEKDVDKVQHDGVPRRTYSRRIAWQAFWYTLSFYVAWIPSTVTRLLQTIPSANVKISFPLVLFMTCCIPLQGFLNFMVYFRAKYLKYRRENPSTSHGAAMFKVAFSRQSATEDVPLETDPGLPELSADEQSKNTR